MRAKLKSLLKDSKRILLSTHLLPDGDGLGAETALYHYLRRAKKACRVYNPDPLPGRYHFLDPKGQFLHGPGQAELWDQWDLWVIVDTDDPRRLGPLWKELNLRAKKIIFLDHHPKTMGLKTVPLPKHASIVSDVKASSIGELVYSLFQDLNLAKLNLDIAQGLYVSVMTDTNTFRYARTTPLSHRIAAEAIELGVNPQDVYQAIYSSKEVSHLRLLGLALTNVKISAGGKLAWIEMTLDERRKHGASVDDTLSFLNLLLLLRDAEVVCLFREEEDGRIRGHLKSKGHVIVNRLAMDLGGGGHDYAAGFALEGTLSSVVTSTVARLEAAIQVLHNGPFRS